MSRVFGFPDVVDEVAARLVAGGVVLLTALYLVTGSTPLLALIAAGFIARVVSGPTLSPLGRLVTQVIVPRLDVAEKLVPGPPKRFAQGIGAALSTTALLLALGGFTTAAAVAVAMITVAASAESFLGYCLGCTIFAKLMAAGILPESACEDCADISRRLALASERA